MVGSRSEHKIDRVTITLVPTADERSYQHVPTTFSPSSRRYGWRHHATLNYMIVPKKISSSEIKVDMFIGVQKGKRMDAIEMQKVVQRLVKTKIESEWQGLRLAGISRASAGVPPQQVFRRGTIEEMLGTDLES